MRAKQTAPSGANITSLETVSTLGGHATLRFVDDQLPSILDVTTSHVRDFGVSDDPSSATALSWSPDGRWLAVAVAHDYDCNDPTGPCDVGQLWIADVKTGAARKVFTTPEGGVISSVDWTSR